MTNGLRDALDAMVYAHRRGARLVLLFDYDGTLVPIAPRPELAVLDRVTRRRLDRLARLPDVVVGVLSGRTLEALKAMVGLDHLYYAGTSGLELDLRGDSMVHPDSGRAGRLIVAVARRMQSALAGYEGAWLEQKPLGLTVHYRDASRAQIEDLRDAVAHVVRAFADGLKMSDGPMAIEIVPNLGWSKRSALATIVRRVHADTVVPLYAGDDANDAGPLDAADTLGGVAIGIGARAPQSARYRLPDPDSLGRCLDELTDMLQTDAQRAATFR